MRRKVVIAAVAICAGMVPAQSAFAQSISATAYVGQSIPLSVPVTASIGGRCEFGTGAAPQGTFDAGQIDSTAWSHDFGFEISCNTASRIAVVSSNGGLLSSSQATDPGYLNVAPYDVTLNLEGDAQTVSDSCAAASLVDTATQVCSFRGTASQLVGLRLPGASRNQAGSLLRVSAPAYAGPGTLVAGIYSDTLIITIAAAP